MTKNTPMIIFCQTEDRAKVVLDYHFPERIRLSNFKFIFIDVGKRCIESQKNISKFSFDISKTPIINFYHWVKLPNK